MIIYFDLFYSVVVIFMHVQLLVALIFHFKVSLVEKKVYAASTYWCTVQVAFAILQCTVQIPYRNGNDAKLSALLVRF